MIPNESDDERLMAFASLPCFLHEFDPAFNLTLNATDSDMAVGSLTGHLRQ